MARVITYFFCSAFSSIVIRLGTTYTSGGISTAVPQPNTCSPGRDVNHCYSLVGALTERDLDSREEERFRARVTRSSARRERGWICEPQSDCSSHMAVGKHKMGLLRP